MSRLQIDAFRVVRLGFGVALIAGLVAGCTSSTTGPPVPTRKVATAASSAPARSDDRVADARCSDEPPGGELTQALGGVSFRTGRVLVRVTRAQEVAPGGVPDADPTAGDGCYAFPKWGNVDPVVPPDSALFVFKDDRSNGAQIETPLAELVSRQEVTAQVGVVARGRYFQAISCALRMTAFSEERAAGSFTCPSAVLSDANPFFPSDDIDATDQSPESPTPAPTTPPPPVDAPNTPDPATAPTAALSGWFEVIR